MAQENTTRKLAEMTDAGAFEKLATSILRLSDSRLRSLSHPGVNEDGKTVKSPVDGIAFVPGAMPPHMIVVHHTICASTDLDKKWLHDPTKVKPRNTSKGPTAPAGDIIKTLEIVAEERVRTPGIKITLILTTNQEPGATLVRNVHAAAAAAEIEIDIWARSRLADVLDNDPRGQWLRSQHLGINQILLSEELLRELSKQNLELYSPPDLPKAWVARTLDSAIEEAGERKIVFIIAESGTGKSVACYKRLLANTLHGGYSFILTDEVIASSISLEQAVEKTLVQLNPALMPGCGNFAVQQSSPEHQLLCVIEDISRSGHSSTLMEKLSRWEGDKAKAAGAASWQLLCPIWPQVMSSLGDEVRKRINSHAVTGTVFSAEEGTEATFLRRTLDGHPVTKLEASNISAALGHDPLLIALHESSKVPDTSQTIAQFIEGSLQRLSVTKNEFLPTEYSKALSDLAKTMLLCREIEPEWINVLNWPALANHTTALRHIIHQGDIVRVSKPSTSEKLIFRHDRVREWLLAQAASDLVRSRTIPDDIVAEPYFAKIFGLVLARRDASSRDVSLIASHSPLALFYALRDLGDRPTPVSAAVVLAIENWLNQPSSRGQESDILRWEALGVLSETENADVRPLVAKFETDSWNALRARYRNGDLRGGIALCLKIEPGVSVVGHEAFLDHVKTRFRNTIISALAKVLTDAQLSDNARVGALRLAGHLGEPALADAVRYCWTNHTNRNQHLDAYLWACAQCVDADPATLLGPVCDEWAALSDTATKDGMPSPRDGLAAHAVRWAFHKKGLPTGAVKYFTERATDSNLNWPITYMLHGLDHPDAVEFVVRELATMSERLEGTDRFSPFEMSATDEWSSRQERGNHAMSAPSRRRLQNIWQDKTNKKHLRKQAFRFWASTQCVGDIAILRTVSNTDVLADNSLWELLRRRDRQAIPAMITKLATSSGGYWWQLGRNIWSDDLTKELDKALELRGSMDATASVDGNGHRDRDWILSELVMRLPSGEAETLLSKHWDQLKESSEYVIAALYVATPHLLERAAAAINTAANPKELLAHLTMRFGCNVHGHPGLSRPEQIIAVTPYLDFLSEMDVYRLWDTCNENRWFDLRRTHLDSRISSTSSDWVYLDDARVMNALDNFLAKQDSWMDIWLEGFLKSGASVDCIMTIFSKWLEKQSDPLALSMACEAVLQIGERRHLSLLVAPNIKPAEHAVALITNAAFGIKRRTLRT